MYFFLEKLVDFYFRNIIISEYLTKKMAQNNNTVLMELTVCYYLWLRDVQAYLHHDLEKVRTLFQYNIAKLSENCIFENIMVN